jgi:hypothetical protein
MEAWLPGNKQVYPWKAGKKDIAMLIQDSAYSIKISEEHTVAILVYQGQTRYFFSALCT